MRQLNKKYWPVQVKTKLVYDKEEAAAQWCKDNMPGQHRWIMAGPNNWYFSKEKDATMFRLRWLT